MAVNWIFIKHEYFIIWLVMKFDSSFQVESYFFQRKLNYRKWNKNICHWITKVCFIILCSWGIHWCHLFSWVPCCYSVKLCPSLSHPMNCSTPCFPVLHTVSQSLLKLMSIESVMPSNHLILSSPFFCPQLFPASGSFPVSRLFTSGGQSIGASASSSVLPMNIQVHFL